MKICAISDLHGQLDVSIDHSTEVLLIAGDVNALHVQRSTKASKKYFNGPFKKFLCDVVPKEVKLILMVAGNHDMYIENHTDDMRRALEGTRAVLLDDEYYEYYSDDWQTLRVYGTPWCHRFGNWAYMDGDEGLHERFNKIPYGCDVLLTHDAPYGVTDVILDSTWFSYGEHIGSIPLKEAIEEKCPVWNIHGHLHSTSHVPEMLGMTKCVNVSLLDERYRMAYEPFYFEV